MALHKLRKGSAKSKKKPKKKMPKKTTKKKDRGQCHSKKQLPPPQKRSKTLKICGELLQKCSNGVSFL